jgi:hypothetical protein
VRDGRPVTIKVPIWDEEVAVNIWRVDVGRVALLLLDTGLSETNARQRFITARLYEANREIRLAQYALLGVGGVRALEALGIDPAIIHMNEGHPAAATLALVGRELADGAARGRHASRLRRAHQGFAADHRTAFLCEPRGRRVRAKDLLRAIGVPSAPCTPGGRSIICLWRPGLAASVAVIAESWSAQVRVSPLDAIILHRLEVSMLVCRAGVALECP